MTAPHVLDGLIEEALPTAGQIAICVKDRDAEGVREVLAPVLDAGDRDRIAALIIALGALVPDDQTYGELLAWTHGQDQLPLGPFVLDGAEKRCGSCKQIKHRRHFHVDRSRRDGLFPRCKVCVSEEHLERKARREQAGRGRREAAA